MLYANQASDLVALSVNFETGEITVTKRIENIFPQLMSPDFYRFDELEEDEILVDWIKKMEL